MKDILVSHTDGPPRAVLVAVNLPGTTIAQTDSSLDELERLAKTLGLNAIGRVTQRRRALAPGKVLGEGKLVELAAYTGGDGIIHTYSSKDSDDDQGEGDEALDDNDEPILDIPVADGDAETDALIQEIRARVKEEGLAKVVVVDHELTPTQQRNLEKATGAQVLDRTSVILEIFARHAKTREAMLQVEVAKLAYLAPRLRESGGGGDRVRGGVGGKGAGETSLELDRRRIRDRIAELRREIEKISAGAELRRQRRNQVPSVALVGYTNAGKSSMMRTLTGGEVYIADKLFATLDTTVRTLHPRTEPPILVSDTVGFISKLPHDVVASFRSTLREAENADLLLYVVDASDPAWPEQFATTQQVLSELDLSETPGWLLCNKCDRLDEDGKKALVAQLAAMGDTIPLRVILMSTRNEEDIKGLVTSLVEHFIGVIEEKEVLIPWSLYGLVSRLREQQAVVSEEALNEGAKLVVRLPKQALATLEQQLLIPQ